MKNTKQTYSTVDRLAARAQAMQGGGRGGGILSAVMLLSGVLSALFFWQNSTAVFSNVWPPAALALGLLTGILPNEGAFFGWRSLMATKTDVTDEQLKAIKAGILAAVTGSIFGTFALFVISFPYVPADIRQFRDWFAFVALGVPIMIQVAIVAWYTVNERGTVENFERAKLDAMGFDAWIRAQQAQLAAIIEGMNAALNEQLENYGSQAGSEEAKRLLGEPLRLGTAERVTQETAVMQSTNGQHAAATFRTAARPDAGQD